MNKKQIEGWAKGVQERIKQATGVLVGDETMKKGAKPRIAPPTRGPLWGSEGGLR